MRIWDRYSNDWMAVQHLRINFSSELTPRCQGQAGEGEKFPCVKNPKLLF